MGLDDGAFVIGVPNDFAREWIEKRLAKGVAEALSEVLGDTVAVRVVVDERAAELTQPEEPPAAADAAPAAEPPRRQAPSARPSHPRRVAPDLNPRYVFERFVTGPHNEYASAVARSVAESPAAAYNPVFIYADTGLGKTHLIQAIAHAVLHNHPELQVRYVTVERFTDEFINAVTDKSRIEGFKQTYRENDVLLIDDVQFLAEKQQTQVEFFHTFNSLYEAGRQIVLTSDRPPRELEALEERLRSRFGQGVVVDISRPDLETRIAILRKQVKWEGFQIHDPEVLEWIASRVTTNIRELYGALTRAVSFASIRGEDLTIDLAKGGLARHPAEGLPAPRDGGGRAGRGRPAVRPARQRSSRQPSHAGGRLRAPDRHVPGARPHGDLAAADRGAVRRPPSHDRHLRDRQGGSAAQGRSRPPAAGPRRTHRRAPQVAPLTPASVRRSRAPVARS